MSDRAGVKVRATTKEARIAKIYDEAKGLKKEPASPSKKKTGKKAKMTMIVAYTTALRTSIEALKTT